MALPPPKAAAAPPLTAEKQREQLDAAHDAAVASLEHFLDRGLAGQRLAPGQPASLVLPLGDHTEEALADVRAHYVAAGWGAAKMEPHTTVAGATVLHLLPVGYVAPEPAPAV